MERCTLGTKGRTSILSCREYCASCGASFSVSRKEVLDRVTKPLYYKSMEDYKFVEPKTQASVRTIYIDTDTIKELQAYTVSKSMR